MPSPTNIDNSQHSLETILSDIILKENQTTLDIATGFFRIEAWMRLEQPLNNLTASVCSSVVTPRFCPPNAIDSVPYIFAIGPNEAGFNPIPFNRDNTFTP